MFFIKSLTGWWRPEKVKVRLMVEPKTTSEAVIAQLKKRGLFFCSDIKNKKYLIGFITLKQLKLLLKVKGIKKIILITKPEEN